MGMESDGVSSCRPQGHSKSLPRTCREGEGCWLLAVGCQQEATVRGPKQFSVDLQAPLAQCGRQELLVLICRKGNQEPSLDL